MEEKQKEFYETLRQETEQKLQTYRDFAMQIEEVKSLADKTIKGLKDDMRFIVKQIEANNNLLRSNGLEPVSFDR